MAQWNGTDERLLFDGALTIRSAEAACAALRDAVTQYPYVRIDCSAAQDVDLSFVQLLIAARLSAHQAGRQLTLAAPPEGPLLSALTRAGFATMQDDPHETAQGFWFEGATA